jgi:hypothetical protein
MPSPCGRSRSRRWSSGDDVSDHAWHKQECAWVEKLFLLPEYLAYRDQNQVFTGLTAYAAVNLTMGGEAAREVHGFLSTCNYFDVLAGPLVLGRGFLTEDCAAPGRSA